MAAPCPCCGAERPDRAERYGLTVDRDPAAVYWQGIRHRLTPAEAATLYLLVQRGRASDLALEMLTTREGVTSGTIAVRMVSIRKWLRRMDPRFFIRHESGGYVLGLGD
ncbi:hypothetical protein [Sphingomonas hankookensis]|uniref:hypothetical protein n=1 Tax=Sphingomonas hankookensis TaxID=563996 RepID=UPI003D3034D8